MVVLLLLFKWGLGGTDGLVELSSNVLSGALCPGLMEYIRWRGQRVGGMPGWDIVPIDVL